MSEFIFMLTRDDVTLADAREVYASIADSGVTHVGCKDVGLPRDELKLFMDEIRANGHTSYLEVVAETDEATLASARVAAEVGPDYCIGGTLIGEMQEILAGTGVKFMPYVGQIVGHPCLLRGSIDEIVADTKAAAAKGVDGATDLPVICAGSVDSAERIRALASHGVWAFTIGTAALDGVLIPGAPLGDQLELALTA
jgi:putative N-acetylmannosamine-6-phosphate epimerase